MREALHHHGLGIVNKVRIDNSNAKFFSRASGNSSAIRSSSPAGNSYGNFQSEERARQERTVAQIAKQPAERVERLRQMHSAAPQSARMCQFDRRAKSRQSTQRCRN